MRTASAPLTTPSTPDQHAELDHLLQRLETPLRGAPGVADACGSAGEVTRRLADRGEVPAYLVVEPQDPVPVVVRTLLAVLRRLSRADRR